MGSVPHYLYRNHIKPKDYINIVGYMSSKQIHHNYCRFLNIVYFFNMRSVMLSSRTVIVQSTQIHIYCLKQFSLQIEELLQKC